MSKYDLLLPQGVKKLNLPSSLTPDPDGKLISGENNSEGDIKRMDPTEAKTSPNSNFLIKQ